MQTRICTEINVEQPTAPMKKEAACHDVTRPRAMKALYYGDNLQVLRDSIATESVDQIYLDPPFNLNATVGRADVCCCG